MKEIKLLQFLVIFIDYINNI